MTNGLGFKELYEVSLKATQSIEVGGMRIEPGETVASFDNIQIANFQEIKSIVSANGGYGNRALIYWDATKELKISFIQGVFSKVQFALMNNTNLISSDGDEIISINSRGNFESDKDGRIFIGKVLREPIFVYNKETGEKITDWTFDAQTIYLKQRYASVVVDYWFDYYNGFSKFLVGRPLTTGFLSLTGKTRVKDDTTGKVVTGIIKIPKLRLMSDLSIRVGNDAIPQVGQLDAIAVPEGVRGQQKVMEIIFLNDDIDADM